MRYLVGFSGGVDSTAAVLLLQAQGHDVETLTLPICGGVNRKQISTLASYLGVKSHFFDKPTNFDKKVIGYFKQANLDGLTPNPCVMCNQFVKFVSMYDFATENGFDGIATGHYARMVEIKGKKRIARASDLNKDQSYVLARVNPKILEMTTFPIGEITRAAGEEMTKNLPTAPTSQDACFALGDTRSWIKDNIGLGNSGRIFSVEGIELGSHKGLLSYTVGQRGGMAIDDGPWYVVRRDFVTNVLIVGRRTDVMQRSFEVTELNIEPINDDDIDVMVRYRARPTKCKIEGNTVHTETPVFAPTPGQFAVFYQGDVVVGSGIIS
ncbi:MAG TPA: hypothetical protein PKV16_00330 [Caldisericia bacterium]|nr:hypothetical protein [Caldisericia bacterium]HPF49140.1 hypothetical protein [Caldisericia bacterium]HPI82996.1 hypothetical protein [Caldisericia bacterium]HPQ92223.1 hypothetical protein [Caldisericia bacterium]HRV74679.1 hypothetical protein [Caldisericia bacterium]